MNSSCVVLQEGKTAQMRGWNSRIGKRKAKSSWIKAMTQVVVAVVVASVRVVSATTVVASSRITGVVASGVAGAVSSCLAG